MKVLVCITMYNEGFDQFLQTMTGVLRAIAELEFYDPKTYKDRIGVVLVADGADKLSDDFKQRAHDSGLMCMETLKKYATKKDQNDKERVYLEFKKIKEQGQTEVHSTFTKPYELHTYSSRNIAHIFSSKPDFERILEKFQGPPDESKTPYVDIHVNGF